MAAITIYLLAMLAQPHQPHASVPTDNRGRTPLDHAVASAAEAFFQDRCHVGLSLAISENGRNHFYNYGTTSKAVPQLPRRTTLFEIGSVTKTMTGILAAQQVRAGRMELDSDFRAYLPEPYPNLERGGKPITLRTLATHSAGMPRDIPANDDLFAAPNFETLPDQLLARERGYDRAAYLRELHSTRLVTDPGANVSYSNIGIKLLSFGIEHVTGSAFDTLLERNIFRPLGMGDTGFRLSAAQRSRLAQGYGPTGKPAPHILPNLGAAGGLISSAEDMVRYAAWNLDEGDPIIAGSHAVLRGDLNSYAMGMMWQMVRTRDDERKIWQSGGVFGMSSQLTLFPETRRAYVALANDACFDTQSQLDTLIVGIHAARKRDLPVQAGTASSAARSFTK